MNIQQPLLAQGVEFTNLDQLKNACREYALQHIFEFKTIRASKIRYEIQCKADNCSWRLYAATVQGTSNCFRIRKYTSEHQCFALNHRVINKRQLHSLQTNLQKRFRNNLSIVFQTYNVICNVNSVLQSHIQEFSEEKRTQRIKSMKFMKMRTNHYRSTA